MDLPQSVEVAARCVETGREFGVDVETWPAVTPRDEPLALMDARGCSVEGFYGNPYSRILPCVAAFCSHWGLWWKSASTGESFLILEHDAVFVARPPILVGNGLCNLGKPSFGAFSIPERSTSPLGPLASKPHLPGAHAYHVSPLAAAALLSRAVDEACPTDVFIHVDRFGAMLKECYPWPVECWDSFTTIQGPKGCQAKHNKVQIV